MHDKPVVVIKIGGALLAEASSLTSFWPAVRALQEETAVVIVHGGGPQATQMARRLGHEPRIVHGRRVTTDLDLQIMLWTVRGELNTRLVSQATAYGIKTVGLSGADGDTVRVSKRPPRQIDGEMVDFGHVGDVQGVKPELLQQVLSAGMLPIVAPLGIDDQGRVYNVNADTIACAIAGTLHAQQFLLVAESGGVRQDKDRPETRLASCTNAMFEQGVQEGWIEGGMRVKLEVAFDAMRRGIPEVFVLSPNDILTRQAGTQAVRF